MRSPAEASGQLFNNADSFAQSFDEAWKRQARPGGEGNLGAEDRRERILAELADHPFVRHDPDRARQVADFRIRLLGL